MIFSVSAAGLACLSILIQSCRSHPVIDASGSPTLSTTSSSSTPRYTPSPEFLAWQKARNWQPPRPIMEDEKYFHENHYNNHYDARYFTTVLPEEERQLNLKYLVQTYLLFAQDIHVQTWLMHGTLLGWWWNKKILPWDSDADFMVMESDMKFLASYHNMTIHHFDLPYSTTTDDVAMAATASQIPMRRGLSTRTETQDEDDSSQTHGYLLDINPAWSNGSTADRANAIDARWIDTATGLYIDLTTLRRNPLDPAGELQVKDRHHYAYSDIFPLKTDTFEGVPALVPSSTADVLIEEYGDACLIKDDYSGHQFDYDKQLWLPFVYDWSESHKKYEKTFDKPNMEGEHPH